MWRSGKGLRYIVGGTSLVQNLEKFFQTFFAHAFYFSVTVLLEHLDHTFLHACF